MPHNRCVIHKLCFQANANNAWCSRTTSGNFSIHPQTKTLPCEPSICLFLKRTEPLRKESDKLLFFLFFLTNCMHLWRIISSLISSKRWDKLAVSPEGNGLVIRSNIHSLVQTYICGQTQFLTICPAY